MNDLEQTLAELNKEFPLVPHTNAGRMFSMVRRMKAEKERNIAISYRSGFAISTKLGKPASRMTEQEWEEFFADLSGSLKEDYPELYVHLFPEG